MMKAPVVSIYPVAQFLSQRQKIVFGALNDDEKRGFQIRFYQSLGSTLHIVPANEQRFIRLKDCEVWALIDDRMVHYRMDESALLKLSVVEVAGWLKVWRETGCPLTLIIEQMDFQQLLTGRVAGKTEEEKAAGEELKKLAMQAGADLACMRALFQCTDHEYQYLKRECGDVSGLRRKALSEEEDIEFYRLWKSKDSCSDLDSLLALVDSTGYALSLIWSLVSDWLQTERKLRKAV